MAVMNHETGFETYPLEKFIALIDEESNLNTAITKLHEEGFGNEDVQYFHGEKGLDILDLCADHHGLIAKIMRVITFTLSREAEEGINMTKKSLDKGGYFISVHARTEDEKKKALSIFTSNNAYNMHEVDTTTGEHF